MDLHISVRNIHGTGRVVIQNGEDCAPSRVTLRKSSNEEVSASTPVSEIQMVQDATALTFGPYIPDRVGSE